MFNGWPCSLWPSNPHCQNSPYNGYNPPQLPAFSRSRVHRDNWLYWVFREYFSGGTRLSCPSTPQLSSNPWSLLKYHHVSVSLSWVLGRWACSFYVASLSHNFFFLGQVVKHVMGGKEVVHTQFMTKSFYTLSELSLAWVGVRNCAALCLSLQR